MTETTIHLELSIPDLISLRETRNKSRTRGEKQGKKEGEEMDSGGSPRTRSSFEPLPCRLAVPSPSALVVRRVDSSEKPRSIHAKALRVSRGSVEFC